MRRHFEKTEDVYKNSSEAKENGAENKARNQILETPDIKNSEKVDKSEKSSENPDTTKKSAREKFGDFINKFKNKENTDSNSKVDQGENAIKNLKKQEQDWLDSIKVDSKTNNKSKELQNKTKKSDASSSDDDEIGPREHEIGHSVPKKIENKKKQTGYDREI